MKFINKLPFKNLLAKPVRSISLVILAFVIALVTFGGAVTIRSLKNGLTSLEKRLGADVIVVPYETRTKESIDSILQNGNRTSFYMPKTVLNEIAQIEGIASISPQIFLTSISAGCCSVKVQIIGFDPETDFTIQPWAHETYRGKLNDFEILVGSEISFPLDRTLSFFNTKLKVAAKLKQTGSGFDNAVYCNISTLKALIKEAAKIQNSPTGKINPDAVVSTVLIKAEDGTDAASIANEINLHTRKVRAVKAKSMTSDIADSLSKISSIAGFLTGVVWILCVFIMMIVFSIVINERKKEFAVLRMTGVPQKKLLELVVTEGVCVNLTGGIAGALFVLLLSVLFKNSLRSLLSLPFLFPSALETVILFVFALALSVFSGIVSSIYMARKISRMDAGNVLRTEG